MPGLARTGTLGRQAQVSSIAIAARLRRGARAVAAGRVALGLTTLAWPSVPARLCVGAADDHCLRGAPWREHGQRALVRAGKRGAHLRACAQPGRDLPAIAAGAGAKARPLSSTAIRSEGEPVGQCGGTWNRGRRRCRWCRPGPLISGEDAGPQAAMAVGAASLPARLREPGSCPWLDCFCGRGSATGLSVRWQCPGELASRRH
jgi:hypothetical protein